MGSITETATAFPGQTGQRPNSVAPLAEMLRLNGFATAAFGKSHETAAWEVSPSGPDQSLADPLRLRQVLRVHRRRGQPVGAGDLRGHEPGRAAEGSELPLHDRHDQPGDQVGQGREIAHAGQAVLHLLRPGRHPRSAPRAEGVDRQVQGQVRPGLGQAPRRDAGPAEEAGRGPAGHQARPQAGGDQGLGQAHAPTRRSSSPARWRSSPATASTPTTRSAGWSRPSRTWASWTTRSIFYIVGDNGASAEGGMNGLFNEMTYFNGVRETVADILKHYDDLGGPTVLRPLRGRLGRGRGYAVHLDEAGRRRITAAPATAWSSTGPSGSRPRAKCARSGITSSTSRRRSWKRPACPSPRSVNGTPQTPIEGVSMVYTFDDAKAKRPAHDPVLRDLRQPRHLPRRLAGRHRPPGALGSRSRGDPFLDDKWELYDTRTDFSLANDLAAKNPEKLKEMQELFMKEAVKNHVLPHRRSRRRAGQRRPGRAARPDGRPHVADGLSRA